MKVNRTVVQTNQGTDCATSAVTRGCPIDGECEAGCDWAHNLTSTHAWKATLPPQQAGEGFTISVSTNTNTDTNSNTNAGTPQLQLSRVAFGDVWFCSGQSNMALPVMNSFSHWDSVSKIEKGMYSNIRLYQVFNIAEAGWYF